MQTFKQKQIALAVGSALMVMAGAAQAVAPAAFGARATKPVLATPALQANANALYAATGFTGALPVTLNIAAPADTVTPANFAVISNLALTVNAANGAATTVGASAATDDVVVFAGAAGATQINLVVTGAVETNNIATTGTATIAFNIVTAVNEALRLNPTSGALEYTTDKTAATITWLPVTVATQVVTGDEILATDSSLAPNTTNITAAVQSVFNTVAPTPVVKTRATNGLVDGVTIDTITPLATLATNSVAITTNAGVNLTAGTALDVAEYTATVNPAGSTVNTIAFTTPATTVNWITGGTAAASAADMAAYAAADFNTGATAPFTVAATATAANQATYSQVFNAADGTAAKLAAIPAAVDGAAPIVTKAVYNNAGALTLTFSEPMQLMGATGDLREITDNVFLGGDSMSALNLNAGGNLTLSPVTNAGGLGNITIGGVQQADVVKAVTVTAGIALKESSDPSYSATVPALDTTIATGPNGVWLNGGLRSVSNVVEGATVTNLASTAAVVAAAFANDTARAFIGAVANKVDRVVVTHSQAMNVPTAAALAGNIIVTVTGNAVAGNPVQFQFIPTAAQLTAITATGFTVTLPTALVYANVDNITGINVQYTAAGQTANVLMTAAATPAVVTAGNINAAIPLSAQPLQSALATMDLSGTVTGAVAGDAVVALLAKWNDANVTTPTVTVKSGKISNPGDKVATDLALEFDNTAALQNAMAAELAKAKAAAAAVPGVSNAGVAYVPKLIPVYVKLVRSNDTAATGDQTGSTRYLDARAILSMNVNAGVNSTSATGWNNNQNDPVYEVLLNPLTGAITGRLTGLIGFKVDQTVTANKERGLHYVGMDGLPTNQAGAAFAQGVVGAGGKFGFMIGADAKPGNLTGAFVVLAHLNGITGKFTELSSVDSGAANFVPFSADITRAGTRAVLPAFDLAKVKEVTLANSAGWQLVALGNPARQVGTPGAITPLTLPRMFEDINNDVGNWIERPLGNGSDMAMALVNNKSFLATELTVAAPAVDGSTLSTIASTSFVPGSVALAFANANPTASTVSVMQAAAPTGGVKLPVGWSLVTVPSSGLLGASVDAVIRVGAQAASQFTWLKTDGAMPAALTPGEAVFVYSKAGGLL